MIAVTLNRATADLTTNASVRDEFSSASYANNDGTVSWSGDWQEST